MTTYYRCTECDKAHISFDLAANCHPVIGGVSVEADPVTEKFNESFTEYMFSPLAQRRAAAREIARMASVRTRIDDALRQLRLISRHLDELTEYDNANAHLDHASDLCAAAISHVAAFQRDLEDA